MLRSGGDVKFTLYVDLVVIWLFVLPMTAYAGLVLKWPVQWVFAVALGAEALIKAPIYTLRIASLVWLKSLVSKEEEVENAYGGASGVGRVVMTPTATRLAAIRWQNYSL